MVREGKFSILDKIVQLGVKEQKNWTRKHFPRSHPSTASETFIVQNGVWPPVEEGHGLNEAGARTNMIHVCDM